MILYIICYCSLPQCPIRRPPTAKAKPVEEKVLFGNVNLKDILSSVVLEVADLDSLLAAGVHDTTDSTGKVNDSVLENKVVVSDDDEDDDDDEDLEMVEANSQKVDK